MILYLSGNESNNLNLVSLQAMLNCDHYLELDYVLSVIIKSSYLYNFHQRVLHLYMRITLPLLYESAMTVLYEGLST